MLVNSTELNQLQKGDKFPIYDSDENRLDRYKDNMKLFDNKIYDIITQQINELPHVSPERKKLWLNAIENIYIQANIPKEVSRLVSDLLGRRAPIIAIEEKAKQESINNFTENNELHTQILETTIDQANKGDIVFKTYKRDDKGKLEAIQPEYYFAEHEEGNKRNLRREFISWTFQKGKRTYRYIETYQLVNSKLNISYQVFEHNTGKLGNEHDVTEFFNIQKHEEVDYDNSLLIFIPLWRCNGDYFGRSIHDGMLPLYDEINNRISQLSKLLDKYSDPTMSGPELDIDEEQSKIQGKPVHQKVIGKYIQREDTDPEVNYHTWPAEIDAHIKYIKEVLFELLYIVTPLNPSLYGLDSSGSISGRAIRLKSFRADCNIDRFMAYWKAGIKRIVKTALALDKKEIELSDISIKWEKGFSKDDKEIAEVEQIRLQSGNTSVKSSIMRQDNVTLDKAKEEYDKIQEEERDQMLNASASLLSQRNNRVDV